MKKIIGILFIVILSFGLAQTAYALSPDDLVGWWMFEENTTDSSTYSNDGTRYGDVSYDDTDEVSGYYSLYDGNGDYVEVVDDSSLDITDEITIEGYIKLDASGNNYQGTIAGKWMDLSGVNERSYLLTVNQYRQASFYISTSGANYPKAMWSTPLELDRWYHLAGTYDGTDIKLYVDGVLEHTWNYPATIHTNNEALLIGANDGYGGSNRKFTDGKIDDVRIWNKALTDEEIMMSVENLADLLNPDSDGDDVLDDADYCPNTSIDNGDAFSDPWGVHRWHWDDSWMQEPNKKGKGENKEFSMTDTHGCSCKQMLDELVAADLGEFGGHYKFGCSSSILEDWISGEYYLETVEVPATSGDGADSINTLESGKEYMLYVSGTYRFANWGEYGIADAEWAYRNDAYKDVPLLAHGWTLGEFIYPSVVGLDLQVDSTNVFWGDFSDTHEYMTAYTGIGSPAHFHIYDSAYGDNSGELVVDIYQKLY